LPAGSEPPNFTAIAISFPILVNAFAILSKRANILCLRFSNILPIEISALCTEIDAQKYKEGRIHQV
jgi:hypothetical protein